MAWAAVFEKLVDKVGLTGAFLFMGFLFIVSYASPEQKRELIDLYVLGKGVRAQYPILVSAVAFFAIFAGERHYHRKQLKTKDQEIQRLGKWKSDHQQQGIVPPLHHTEERK